MVSYYPILGRQVGSHHLAIGVLSTLFGTTFYFTRPSPAKLGQGPAINAKSPDEEKFIKDFMASVEGDKKEAKH